MGAKINIHDSIFDEIIKMNESGIKGLAKCIEQALQLKGSDYLVFNNDNTEVSESFCFAIQKGIQDAHRRAKGGKNEEALEVLEYLNNRRSFLFPNSTGFKMNKKNETFINGRLKDGYTVEDLKIVIDLKCLQWANNINMRAYIRPETLFNQTKFEAYLAEASIYVENENQKKLLFQNYEKGINKDINSIIDRTFDTK